jgi:hypothetical protein
LEKDKGNTQGATIMAAHRCVAAGLALALAATAARAGNGLSIEGQPVFGELGVNLVNSDPFDDANFFTQIQDTGVVGPPVEVVLVDPHLTGDFSQTGDVLVVHVNASFADLPFNGLRFRLTDPGAPVIGGLVFVSSTFPGLDASRVSFTGSRVALNYAGLFGAGDVTLLITWVDAPDPCPADLDGDGEVGITDLLALLAAWGPNPGHPSDLDGDGQVGITDLLALLALWGPCGA